MKHLFKLGTLLMLSLVMNSTSVFASERKCNVLMDTEDAMVGLRSYTRQRVEQKGYNIVSSIEDADFKLVFTSYKGWMGGPGPDSPEATIVLTHIDSKKEKFREKRSNGQTKLMLTKILNKLPANSELCDNEDFNNVLANGDGTKTLRYPKFKVNGNSLVISPTSDLDGVCKLYGLQSHLPNTLKLYDRGDTTGYHAVISSNGTISGYVEALTREENRAYADFGIHRLICE